MNTAKQDRKQAGVLRHGKGNHDKDESTWDEPVRRVPMPEHVKQKQMSCNKRHPQEGEQPAVRRKAFVFHHGFDPLAKTALPRGSGAPART